MTTRIQTWVLVVLGLVSAAACAEDVREASSTTMSPSSATDGAPAGQDSSGGAEADKEPTGGAVAPDMDGTGAGDSPTDADAVADSEAGGASTADAGVADLPDTADGVTDCESLCEMAASYGCPEGRWNDCAGGCEYLLEPCGQQVQDYFDCAADKEHLEDNTFCDSQAGLIIHDDCFGQAAIVQACYDATESM